MLDGQLALVTGSSAGIGRAIARSLLDAGARVIVNGRNQDRVDNTVEELRRLSSSGKEDYVKGVAADLSTAEGANELCDAVDATGRPLDILVCNTGIFEAKDFFETTDADWQTYHDVNIMSTVRLARRFLRDMLDRGRGRIIVLASEAAFKPVPQLLAYSTSKSALVGLARGLAELTKGTDVTVNSVLAGPTTTEGVQAYFRQMAEREHRPVEDVLAQYFKEHEPTSLAGRLIRPEEVAAAVSFLASPAASAINGSSQRVEGGIIRHI